MCDANAMLSVLLWKKNYTGFFFPLKLAMQDSLKKKKEALLNTNAWTFFNGINLDLLWHIVLGIIYGIMSYGTPQGINKEVNCSSEMYNFHPLPLNQWLAKQ